MPDVARILDDLGSANASEAWVEFLESYASLIQQVIHLQERDPDRASDCFLFMCERLSEKQFRRLRSFQLDGPASFRTWLRAVVRHLFIEWHRHRSGRQRVFRSIARLSVLEQEIYRCVFEQGMAVDIALLTLRPRFPTLSRERLADRLERVRNSLSPRQLSILNDRAEEAARQPEPLGEAADSRPDPEALAVSSEEHEALARALPQLSDADRLLLRLRFEEELTLEQIGRVADLRSPQRVDLRIRGILETLRKLM